MKFIIQHIKNKCRSGKINEIPRLPDLCLETPLLLIYTRSGCVPHLTREVFEMVTEDNVCVHLPLPTTIHMEEALSKLKLGISEFVSMKDHLLYCSVQDPAVDSPSGHNDKSSIAISSRSGHRSLTPDTYMDLMETFRPDMYQALCDGDTNIKSSKKRVQKSVERTSLFLRKCVDRHNNSEVLRGSGLLGVVEGGFKLRARQESAALTAQQPVFGFVIDGFDTNGPDIEKLSFSDVRNILEETVKLLPEDKIRVVHGCWNPSVILEMVETGVDVFDSSYPFIVSERGSALIFCNDLESVKKCVNVEEHGQSNDCLQGEEISTKKTVQCNGNDETVKCETGAVNSNKCQRELSESPSGINCASISVNKQSEEASGYEIFLGDNRYREDFRPINESCECLSCRKHTRAYIHHLISTKELLGHVLLSIHNLHHYLVFFKSIRTAVKTNQLHKLKTNLSTKLRIE